MNPFRTAYEMDTEEDLEAERLRKRKLKHDSPLNRKFRRIELEARRFENALYRSKALKRRFKNSGIKGKDE